jgi:hypothetical protein
VEGGYLMPDTTGVEKTGPEPPEIPFRRRIVLAAGNLGCLVVVFVLAARLAGPLAAAGVSWWVGVLILLVPLVAVDFLLRAVLLRPVRRSPRGSGAPTHRPPPG